MKNRITRIEHYEDMVVVLRGATIIHEYNPSDYVVKLMKDVLSDLYELGLVKPSQSYITLGYRFDILDAPVYKGDLDELGCHGNGTLVPDLLTDEAD